jgi:hypothetical protein
MYTTARHQFRLLFFLSMMHPLDPARAIRLGYTSFEEPSLDDEVTKIPAYADPLGDAAEAVPGVRQLESVGGGAVLSYDLCSAGADELGFTTFYDNVKGNKMQEELIGIVVETMNFVPGNAPDGNRYFLIEQPRGFAFVVTDAVVVGPEYSNVQLVASYFLKDAGYRNNDYLKIWATDGDGADTYISDMVKSAFMEGAWTEQQGTISNTEANPLEELSLAFGFFSEEGGAEAYFDNLVLSGDGPQPEVRFYDATCEGSKGREVCSKTDGVCGWCLPDHVGIAGDSNVVCIDCTGSPACAPLHRDACSAVANTCGPCKSGYLQGSSGSSNDACIVDCDSAPFDCSALHRADCQNVPNKCGPCLPGTVGSLGSGNDACVDCSNAPECFSLNRLECSETPNTCNQCAPGATSDSESQTASNGQCTQTLDHASMATLGWQGTIAYASFEEPATFTATNLVGNAWTVSSGSCAADGWCVQSPSFPTAYDASEGGAGECVLVASESGRLSCPVFDTVPDYDVFGAQSRQLHLVTSGTCEERGYSHIIGADWCNFAMHAYLQLDGDPTETNPRVEKLYGSGDCEIGVDNGVDYGRCKGVKSSVVAGCSLKDGRYKFEDGKNIYSNTGAGAECSISQQCLCTSGITTLGESAYTLDDNQGFHGLNCPMGEVVSAGKEYSWVPGSGTHHAGSSHRWEICIQPGNERNYIDTGDASVLHELSNNVGENIVQYDECSHGSSELGFRTYYGLVDVSSAIVGDIGTINDRTGVTVPHGDNVFTLENTGSFVHVELDVVDLSLYSGVVVYAWVRENSVTNSAGGDAMKVWLTKAISDGNEVLVADNAIAQEDSQWHQHSEDVPEWPFVAMHFGLQSGGQAWFDFMRFVGIGVEPVSLPYFEQSSSSTCLALNRRGCSQTAGVCGPCRTNFVGDPGDQQKCIDCRTSPDCKALFRYACASTANTCGSCLPGMLGTSGDENTQCLADCSEAPDCAALQRDDCTTIPNTCGACYDNTFGTAGIGNTICYSEVRIAHTGFEEPHVIGGATIPDYTDTVSLSSDHVLLNNANENPVQYSGDLEIGFQTWWYIHKDRQALSSGVGVVSNSMAANPGAHTGSQYYIVADTRKNFVVLETDSVNLQGYSQVRVSCWAYIASGEIHIAIDHPGICCNIPYGCTLKVPLKCTSRYIIYMSLCAHAETRCVCSRERYFIERGI